MTLYPFMRGLICAKWEDISVPIEFVSMRKHPSIGGSGEPENRIPQFLTLSTYCSHKKCRLPLVQAPFTDKTYVITVMEYSKEKGQAPRVLTTKQ